MNTVEILQNLCNTNGLTENDESDFICGYLLKLSGNSSKDAVGNVTATFKGESDYTILLDAHIDKIGLTVTGITKDGFIKCAAVGGIDSRVLPAQEVVIYGKEAISGVIQTLPPHLVKDEEKPLDSDKIYVDAGMNEKQIKEIVNPGDFIVFKSSLLEMINNCVTAAALDDRAGCASLILVAEKLAEEESLPCNVKLLFSNGEELGCRGAKTGAFKISPDEAIAIDVSFADDMNTPESKCGKLRQGAMIGISPVLSKKISDKLIKTAEDCNINYQKEVMGKSTGTNADVIGITKEGIPTGLLSIPLRNMHTPVEVVSMDDIKSVGDILFNYIMDGGIKNA